MEPNKKEWETIRSTPYQVWRASYVSHDGKMRGFYSNVAIASVLLGLLLGAMNAVFYQWMATILAVGYLVFLAVYLFKAKKKYSTARNEVWGIREEIE